VGSKAGLDGFEKEKICPLLWFESHTVQALTDWYIDYAVLAPGYLEGLREVWNNSDIPRAGHGISWELDSFGPWGNMLGGKGEVGTRKPGRGKKNGLLWCSIIQVHLCKHAWSWSLMICCLVTFTTQPSDLLLELHFVIKIN
jgi:hypothetical protein